MASTMMTATTKPKPQTTAISVLSLAPPPPLLTAADPGEFVALVVLIYAWC